MTADEIADFKDAFTLFDRSGEGEMKAGDLVQLLRALGHDVADHEVFALVHAVVGDVVGETVSAATVLSFPQFLTLMSQNAEGKGVTAADTKATFHAMDGGNKGALDVATLEALAVALGEPPEDISDMIRAVDPGAAAISPDALDKLMRHGAP
eukprot:a844996_19.p2 GENE.a844996_19~~a844996_19.p2  ORF type:complete len:168 (+),score=52.87 a844996_19:47-505(+)